MNVPKTMKAISHHDTSHAPWFPSAMAPASATERHHPQGAVADTGAERTAGQLVQRVRGDPHSQEEPRERQRQVVAREDDRGHRPERDV